MLSYAPTETSGCETQARDLVAEAPNENEHENECGNFPSKQHNGQKRHGIIRITRSSGTHVKETLNACERNTE